MKKTVTYDESSISYFKSDLLKIRAKPAMYIGPTDSSGIFTILREAADNAVDEARAGRNSLVHIFCEKDSFWVQDEGVGIPTNIHPKAKISTLTYVISNIQSSGKMEGNAYKSAIGTHGIGIKATNALSKSFEVWTFRSDAGGWNYTKFESGKETVPVTKTKSPLLPNGKKPTKGTIIKFSPDEKIFLKEKLQLNQVETWCDITAHMNAGLKIILSVKGKKDVTWYAKDGIKSYLERRISELKCTPLSKTHLYCSTETMDVAIAFADAEGCEVEFFTNTIRNVDLGFHAEALFKALVDSLKPYKGKLEYTPADLKEGLIGVFNYKIDAPQFSSQTKEKLVDIRIKQPCYEQCMNLLTAYWKTNKILAKQVVTRAAELRKKTADFLKDKKLIKQVSAAKKGLASKLADVQGNKVPIKDREIFAVEGDSAGGSAKLARDKSYQAVYSLKGKPLNVMEATKDKINNNAEIAGLLAAINLDLSAEDPISKIRFGKIIFMADPDVDGPLHYNERVLTLDGKNPKIGELAKKWKSDPTPFWVYSRDSNSILIPALAENPRKTKEITEIAYLKLDRGKVIKCSLDHKWVINEPRKSDKRLTWYLGNAYCATKDLKKGDSINSVYFKNTNSDGEKVKNKRPYLSINKDLNGKIEPVHRWVKRKLDNKNYIYYKKANKGVKGRAIHIHHKDDNSLNNSPENLEFLTKEQHYGHHGREMNLEYNGSQKHLNDLERFFASEAGQEAKKRASKTISNYNRSDKHRETVAKNNSKKDYIHVQMLGRIARYYLGLQIHQIKINKTNWNKYLQLRVPTWENLSRYCSIEEIENFIAYKNYKESDAYTPEIREKAIYDSQAVTKFVNVLKLMKSEGLKLNENNYTEFRKARAVRGDPKWLTIFPLLGIENSHKSIFSFLATYKSGKILKETKSVNHKVVSIEVKKLKNPKSVYCLTVPKTGNFMVDDGDGNGICSANCHINCLLLGVFWKFLPQLFREGRIHIVNCPEFICRHKGKVYFGNSVEDLRKQTKTEKIEITHLKGLGEINAEDLRVMAMSPATRSLITIKSPNSKEGIKNFESLMGKNTTYKKVLLGI